MIMYNSHNPRIMKVKDDGGVVGKNMCCSLFFFFFVFVFLIFKNLISRKPLDPFTA